MPNWCETTYKAVGTKEQVKQFYDLAMSSWNKTKEQNQGWLGHFVTELGGEWEKVPCRGWMQDAPQLDERNDEDYAECTIYCETAWGELTEWRHFVEQHIDGLIIGYLAIEPGCGVYLSNMDEYIGKVYVDSSEYETDFYTEVGAIEHLQEWYQKDYETIEDWVDFAREYSAYSDNFLYINFIEEGD